MTSTAWLLGIWHPVHNVVSQQSREVGLHYCLATGPFAQSHAAVTFASQFNLCSRP